MHIEKCPHCEGTGRVVYLGEERRCYACWGTGKDYGLPYWYGLRLTYNR